MPCTNFRQHPCNRTRGFTLIELMIVVVIVAVLAAVAYPSYLSSVRKGRRAEAVSALTGLQQTQERWRANNQQYGATLASLAGTSPTASGYYELRVDAASANSYILTATAVPGTSQAADTSCNVMRLQLVGGAVSYGGCNGCALPTAPATVTDPDRCWAR